MNNKVRFFHLILVLALATLATAVAVDAEGSITRVGNGDDGGDLEGAKKIESGMLVETRNKAVERIKRLDPASIEHLSSLLPELEKSEMYLVTRDLKPKLDEDHGLESDPSSQSVYARTFAEPHAATRFFPAALTLNEEQLIALHVHEALHRALPPSVRENEKIVTKITLALVSPDANVDRVRRIVRTEIPDRAMVAGEAGYTAPGTLSAKSDIASNVPPLEQPSSVTYAYRMFFIPDQDKAAYPIQSLHSIQSFFYPFGEGPRAFGLGIEASYIRGTDQSFMGPLSLSARMRLTSVRGYDVSGFAVHSMNSTAPDELKNSPLGRDLTTIGVIARRETSRYYVENSVSLTGQGSANQTLGKIDYKHEYGAITKASVKAGARYEGFELGGFGEAILADSYKVTGGAFKYDSGRYRIIAAGPEIGYVRENLRVGIAARWIIDATSGAKLDDLGDIMGHGLGQGSVTSSISLRF